MADYVITSRFGGVLVVCVLVCSSISSANGEWILKCSGETTTFTYTDCETDRTVRDGCYYLVHFEQYRPCNDICDGIEMWSINEERCRSYCPGYMEANCGIFPSVEIFSWLKPYVTYTQRAAYHGMMEEPRKSKQPSIMLVLKVISAALLINAISLFLIVSLCYKTFWYHPTSKNQVPSYINHCRRRRNQNPASHQLQTHGLFPEGLPFDQMAIQATTVPQLLKAFLLMLMYMAALLAVTISSLALPVQCHGQGSSRKRRQLHDQYCPPASCVVVPTDTAESQMTADPSSNIPDGDISMTKYANNHYCDSYMLRSRIVEALLRLVDGCA